MRHFQITYNTGVIMLVFMQILDMGLTYAFLGSNYAVYEINPLMRGIATNFESFFVAKLLGIGFVVVLGELMRKYDNESIAHSIVWVAAGFSACVVWSNIMVILAVLGNHLLIFI